MDDSTKVLVVIVVAMIASRLISESGYRLLNFEEKLRLMNGFSRFRITMLLPLILMVGLFVVLKEQQRFSPEIIRFTFAGAMLFYTIAYALLIQNRLRQLALPRSYCHRTLFAQMISFAAVAWLFITNP